ncbi:hypothetical protein Pelo_19599 [Pelomyxa schiedti]|nr:hypothetical protein Pelo_19599 [Pelomyxa schiedti]
MTAVATNEIASLARCALSAASQVVALGVGARSRRCGARSPARLLDPSSLRALAVSWVLPPARRSLVSLHLPFADGPPDFTTRRYHDEEQPDDDGALLRRGGLRRGAARRGHADPGCHGCARGAAGPAHHEQHRGVAGRGPVDVAREAGL